MPNPDAHADASEGTGVSATPDVLDGEAATVEEVAARPLPDEARRPPRRRWTRRGADRRSASSGARPAGSVRSGSRNSAVGCGAGGRS